MLRAYRMEAVDKDNGDETVMVVSSALRRRLQNMQRKPAAGNSGRHALTDVTNDSNQEPAAARTETKSVVSASQSNKILVLLRDSGVDQWPTLLRDNLSGPFSTQVDPASWLSLLEQAEAHALQHQSQQHLIQLACCAYTQSRLSRCQNRFIGNFQHTKRFGCDMRTGSCCTKMWPKQSRH